jgi:hypothetical protein
MKDSKRPTSVYRTLPAEWLLWRFFIIRAEAQPLVFLDSRGWKKSQTSLMPAKLGLRFLG